MSARVSSVRLQSVAGFLLVYIQLLILAWIVEGLRIQQAFHLDTLMWVTCAGLPVYYWLPGRYRILVLVLLAVITALAIFPVDDSWFVILSVLIFFSAAQWCAVRFRRRSLRMISATLLAALVALFVALRTGDIEIPSSAQGLALPVIGSMLMFRLLLFLHEVRFEKEKVPALKRLSYLFMLPNMALPLFPVIDYKTFVRGPIVDSITSQRGVRLIARGALHLMLYRLLYHQFLPDPLLVSSAVEAVQYMVVKYALIIQLSGLFHLAVGILCLFGFNLPEVFNNYFLARNFNDLWRRINIYWKDFMMKVVYYPIFFRIRGFGTGAAMAVSILAVFTATWLLHSWQWFWIRGNFPLNLNDVLFWGVLGLLVSLNALHQRSRAKRISSNNWSWGNALTQVLQIGGMLLFMSVLWTFWTHRSISDWLQFIERGSSIDLLEALYLLSVVIGLIGAGFVAHYLLNRQWTKRMLQLRGMYVHMLASLTMIMPLALFNSNETRTVIQNLTRADIGAIATGGLNVADSDRRLRGYYEDVLLTSDPFTPLWEDDVRRPDDWLSLSRSGGTIHQDDILQRHLKPSISIMFKGTTFTTNQWGMRDREYSKEKPPHVIRFALLGGSSEMGSGVRDNEVIDEMVEDKLNSLPQLREAGLTVEILNFSVIGYHLHQHVHLMKDHVPMFEPDVVLYISPEFEEPRLSRKLGMLRERNYWPDDSGLVALFTRAGIEREASANEVAMLLKEFEFDIVEWGYESIVRSCRTHGIKPVWVYMPTLDRHDNLDQEFERLRMFAGEVGFITTDLRRAYDGQDLESLVLAPYDRHPNARAHELLSEVLYEEIIRLAPQLAYYSWHPE